MVKKESGDSWAHQNSIILYSQLLRKFDFQEVGNLFGLGVHLLFTYSRILWLLDPLHLFYMCTSAFCFFITCNLMLYSFDSCFLIMVSKISLTVMVLFVSPSLCWDFSYFEVHHADCKWIISLIHQLVHWKSCMENNILCLIFWCCCSGLHIRQKQTFWRR